MKSTVLSQFDMTYLPQIGLVLFFLLFVSVLFWIYRKGSGDLYNNISQKFLDKE